MKWLNNPFPSSPPNIFLELNNFRKAISPTVRFLFWNLNIILFRCLIVYFGKSVIYAVGNFKC